MPFPDSPADGAVVEIWPELVFSYEASTNSWVRVEGVYPLATPTNAGLMSAADYQKLSDYVIPPPESTIMGQGCQDPFTVGTIALQSGDGILKIDPTAKLSLDDTVDFRITKHTAGFNFSIDKDALIAELKRRGQFQIMGPDGPQGDQGATGAPGLTLPTGPPGSRGTNGQGPPCNFTLSPDGIPYETVTTGLAILDIAAEVRGDSGYLVLKRGLVGNPDLAPQVLSVTTGQSSWLLAVSEKAAGPQTLFFVDVGPLVDAIHFKFNDEVVRLKRGMESVVGYWLETMSALFDTNKAALCCALSACKGVMGQTAVRSVFPPVEVPARALLPAVSSPGLPAPSISPPPIKPPGLVPAIPLARAQQAPPKNGTPVVVAAGPYVLWRRRHTLYSYCLPASDQPESAVLDVAAANYDELGPCTAELKPTTLWLSPSGACQCIQESDPAPASGLPLTIYRDSVSCRSALPGPGLLYGLWQRSTGGYYQVSSFENERHAANMPGAVLVGYFYGSFDRLMAALGSTQLPAGVAGSVMAPWPFLELIDANARPPLLIYLSPEEQTRKVPLYRWTYNATLVGGAKAPVTLQINTDKATSLALETKKEEDIAKNPLIYRTIHAGGGPQFFEHAGGMVVLATEGSAIVSIAVLPVFQGLGQLLTIYEQRVTAGSASAVAVRLADQDYILIRLDENRNIILAWPTISGSFVPVPSTGSVRLQRDERLSSELLTELKAGRVRETKLTIQELMAQAQAVLFPAN